MIKLKGGDMAPETHPHGIRQRLDKLIQENYNIAYKDILKLTDIERREYKRDLQLKKLIAE